jgi:hypothetical protein
MLSNKLDGKTVSLLLFKSKVSRLVKVLKADELRIVNEFPDKLSAVVVFSPLNTPALRSFIPLELKTMLLIGTPGNVLTLHG